MSLNSHSHITWWGELKDLNRIQGSSWRLNYVASSLWAIAGPSSPASSLTGHQRLTRGWDWGHHSLGRGHHVATRHPRTTVTRTSVGETDHRTAIGPKANGRSVAMTGLWTKCILLKKTAFTLGVTSKKRVYLKTLSIQVGGWSRPFQNFFNELIFDIRWGLSPY